ncbi:MAG TPA: hypothetical protein PKE26_07550 [Kiritimatiellia bacterium]|nr:hypothetical protein [Kiritimatiellia bacterium]HMO98946.1 hypothetical protein [Kiritimatiellia bacterium]
MAKKTSVKMLAVITGVALALPPGPTFGQFLRLGPFDFDAQTFLEAIYTTNVEQERPSDATADREDFYLVWGLDLKSTAQFFPRTTVSLDTGIAIEKHFNRSDLDNSRAPFGRVIGRFDTDWDPIKLYGGVRYERTSESVDDKFIPAGKPKKRRQVGTKLEYLAGTDYIGRYVDVGTYYSLLQERYDSFDFFEEESDEATWFYYGRIKLTEKIRLGYEVERTKTDFVNLPDGEGDWEKTEKILLDFTQILFERPKVTYSVGLLREYDDEGETEGWEWTHTINVSDEWDISPT